MPQRSGKSRLRTTERVEHAQAFASVGAWPGAGADAFDEMATFRLQWLIRRHRHIFGLGLYWDGNMPRPIDLMPVQRQPLFPLGGAVFEYRHRLVAYNG